ncbi:MAG TPA: cache domain-containing protein, partial [Rhodoferax sp.]
MLVLAVSVPFVAVVGYGIYSDRQQTIAHTKTSLRMLTSTMVSNTGGKIVNARQILERLATRPLVKQVDPKNCDGALKDLYSLNPGYANVLYTHLEGVAVCSAVPQPGGKPLNFGKTPWFEQLMKERRFTVGQPYFGPISGKWVSVLSSPIWNERQEMVGGIQL